MPAGVLVPCSGSNTIEPTLPVIDRRSAEGSSTDLIALALPMHTAAPPAPHVHSEAAPVCTIQQLACAFARTLRRSGRCRQNYGFGLGSGGEGGGGQGEGEQGFHQ